MAGPALLERVVASKSTERLRRIHLIVQKDAVEAVGEAAVVVTVVVVCGMAEVD